MRLPTNSKAVVLRSFGGPEQLDLAEVQTPQTCGPREIIVRVHATSVNPIEWKMRSGLGLPKVFWRALIGKRGVLGLDYSGTVATIGERVREYSIGDDVMGAVRLCGTYAEYIVLNLDDRHVSIARKPAGISHEDAAMVPFAALVAYAGLVTYGRAETHRSLRVLVIGASGGVGHLAVQMARRCLDAEMVAGISSARNRNFVMSCGAHSVIAYDEMQEAEMARACSGPDGHFDIILDCVGSDFYWRVFRSALRKPGGLFISAALPKSNASSVGEDVDLLGSVWLFARLAWRRIAQPWRMIPGLFGLPAKSGFPDIARWMAEGKLGAHKAASYPLSRIAEAHHLVETGHVAGKISITMGELEQISR